MDKIIEMKNLIEELNKASDAYYNTGNTIMSDKEFDSKLSELESLEKEVGVVLSNSPTQRVGAPVLNKLDKVTHEFKPMLSLAKVHSAEEIIKFANGQELLPMIKLDGLSVRLTYNYGVLSKAETRGDGVTGSDITLHVKQFENVPLIISNKAESYVVDGEAIIIDSDFASINAALPEGEEKFKNSRNLASGTLALLDTSLVKKRHLRFVAWDVIVGTTTRRMIDKLKEVDKLGFETVPYCFSMCQHAIQADEEEINMTNDILFKEARDYGYPIDGIVWKINDIRYGETLGQTSHHFCNAVAFKRKNEEYETILTDVEWNTSKTGLINPIAVFQPVEIEGSTITKATLHNLSYMKDMRIAIGGTITVIKSNEVIPKVTSCIADRWDFKIPTKCPVCGGRTEIRKDNDTEVLVCTNDNCKGKLLGKLSHAVSKNALNIDGLSEAILNFMIEELGVKSIKDLYQIPFYNEVYERWIETPGFGKRSVDKLRDAIEKSRNTTLERFLYAQSVNLIGKTASKDISKYCKGSIDTFCDIMANGNKREFLSIDGFGQTMLESLENWYENHWVEFLALKSEFKFESNAETTQNKNANNNTDLSRKTFVITGALNHFDNREQLKELLESLGAKVSNSVSAKTFALVCNDKNSNTGKSKKAKDLNIQTWTEDELLKFLNEVNNE